MSPRPELRLGVLAVVVVSLFAALLARLGHLQLVAADRYEAAAAENSVTTVSLQAPRGRILDRNGVVLVDNRAAGVVAVRRSELRDEDRPAVLASLSGLLGTPVDALAERLDDPAASPYLPVPVADDVAEPALVAVRERVAELPGVVAERVPRRSYPAGNVAPHLLGWVGEADEADLRGDIGPGDLVGRTGVERAFDADLRGVDGALRVEVDARDRPVRVVGRREPVPGRDVVLALDVEAQRVAERALAEGLAAARGRPFEGGAGLVADAGSVVALDARTGGVLALASSPAFDLPALADGISEAEAAVLFPPDDRAAAFSNRALEGEYAPGSTWKLVTALAGLRSGVVTPSTVVADGGTYAIPGCSSGCTRRNAGGTAYGRVDLGRAMAVSSDVYFYGIGAELWRRAPGETSMQAVAAELGFGAETGIAVGPEQPGLLITPALRAERHDADPAAFPERDWFVGSNVNLAIGQGELGVTPLQLASAYATFGNGGTRRTPAVVLRVEERTPDGSAPHVVRELAPQAVGSVDLPAAFRDPLVDGLLRVTTSGEGTAADAFAGWPSEAWPVAGKTGTAQVAPKQDTALFAGFGPVPDPQYAVSVVMEQAGFGASAAAPVARAVFGHLSGAEVVG